MATLPTVPRFQPTERLYRITIDQYHKMTDQGVLTKHDRVVLLDGLLVSKMTKGDPHVTATRPVFKALERLAPDGWLVCKEDPIALPAGPTGLDSEPEPDVSVIRGTIRDYSSRKPLPADVSLVVEVADRSLADDRAGLARYAWAGIPEAWIVNLRDMVVEVHGEPSGPADNPAYRKAERFGPGAFIRVALGDALVGEVAVTDLLP